jgi:DNA processing protein
MGVANCMYEELHYLIALSSVQGLGPIKSKSLLKHIGSAQAIFRIKPSILRSVPEIGRVTADAIANADLHRAEKEIEFIIKEGIRVAAWSDEHYPARLRQCDDSPLILYARGNFEWNPKKSISIVGTRKADNYGRQFCNTFLEELSAHKPTVVSGLAHGIDAMAHAASVELNLPTIACVAHGLNQIYPPIHKSLASKMELNGGILTEFKSHTPIAPEMFPMRNRIIAGLSDCTIVVQTDLKGGSMITAHIAHSYGREVFAVPGRVNDTFSRGCHKLIKNNIAAVITCADDLVQYLQWDLDSQSNQTTLDFSEHSDPHASLLLKLIQLKPEISFDDLITETQFDWGLLNTILLQLEFDGLLIGLPGKRFKLKR